MSAKPKPEFVEDKRGRRQIVASDGNKYDVSGYRGDTRVGFMCGTDWNDELGAHACLKSGEPEGTKVYDSVEDLVAARGCTHECGHVKVLMVAVEVEAGDLFHVKGSGDGSGEKPEPVQ